MFPISDLKRAREYALALPRGAATPDVDGANCRLTASMASYVLDFQAAKQKHSLHQFDVQQRLHSVRMVSTAMFSSLRSLAGLLILCGLLATLWNLQGAVGPLGKAFKELANQQRTQSRETSAETASAHDKTSHIQTTMSDVAASAQKAFAISFGVILAAASLMLFVLLMQRHAVISVAKFSAWAEQAYRNDLPEQISMGEAASTFKESAQALSELTRYFNDLSVSLESVKNFGTTMEDVREAIVKALDRMPGEIQASMNVVTKDMVKNLERSMKDEVEAIKKILAIYGQQEFRIDEIGKHVSAVKELTEQIAGAATTLEAVPKQLAVIDASLRQHTSVAGRIEATAKQIEESVLAFPSEELRGASKALIDATANIGRAHTQAVEAIADLQGKTASIGKLDLEVGKKLETITTVSQQFLGAYDNLLSNFNSGQKLVAESLERVATQIGHEITKLADREEIATVSAQLKKLELAFDDFRNRLRLVRTPSPAPVTAPPPKGANNNSETVAAGAAAGQSSPQQIGTAARTVPDRVLGIDTAGAHKPNGDNGGAATTIPGTYSDVLGLRGPAQDEEV